MRCLPFDRHGTLLCDLASGPFDNEQIDLSPRREYSAPSEVSLPFNGFNGNAGVRMHDFIMKDVLRVLLVVSAIEFLAILLLMWFVVSRK